jgi:hypothetical protein
MERGDQKLPSGPAKMAAEKRGYTPEQERAILGVAQLLASMALGEEFSLLLRQLANRACHQQATVAPCHELGTQPRQLPVPSEGVQASAEPPRKQATEKFEPESNHGDPSSGSAEAEVVVGSLRTAQEDRWVCKVPSCTGSFHRLKDCKVFHGMEPEDRVKLVERHKLCLGCLTPSHGRAARSCPYKEERADVCQRTSCKARHHHLLHLEKRRTRTGPGEGPPSRPPGILPSPTPTEEPGHAVQLVAQWISTKGGAPSLVFWDTGSKVTLVTHKAAKAMKLTVIPSSPLRLEGIGDGHRSKATTRYKVPLIDTGGRVITVTAYGIESITSPLGGGDITLMREAFPEVPAGGLVSAAGEVSLLMGQDNLSLFPTERWRVGNAALYMSRFGTGWIASGKPPRAKGGGDSRHVGVCVVRTADQEVTIRPEPHEEDTRSAHCQQHPSNGQPRPCTSREASSNPPTS